MMMIFHGLLQIFEKIAHTEYCYEYNVNRCIQGTYYKNKQTGRWFWNLNNGIKQTEGYFERGWETGHWRFL